jgi:histidine ammonia-lyase
MTILQAIDYLNCGDRLSPHTEALYTEIRKIFPKFIEDRPRYKEMEHVRAFLETTHPAILFNA